MRTDESGREPRASAPPAGPQPGLPSRVYAWLFSGPLRFLVIAAWGTAIVLAMMYLPSLADTRENALASIAPADARAVQTEIRSARLFQFPVLSRTAVVQYRADGLPDDVQREVVERALAVTRGQMERSEGLVGALPIINMPGLFAEGGEEASTTAITWLLFDPRQASLYEQVSGAEEFAEEQVDRPGQGLVGVTGLYPAWVEQGTVVESSLLTVTLATVALIALVVGLTFRSVGAPVITLLAGFIAYLVAQRVVAYLADRAGISAPVELQPLMVVLLLGIVTDYAVFYLSGQRYHLQQGSSGSQAARMAAAEYGSVIVTAGLMVAAGTMGLLVATLDYFRAFGPGMALTVLVGLAVSVTLIPALLATFGRLVFWPRRFSPLPLTDPPETPRLRPPPLVTIRQRLLWLSTHRAVALPIAAVCVAGLVFASLGLRELRIGLNLISGLPDDSAVERAAQLAKRGFAEGIISPTEIVVESPRGDRSALLRLERLIAAQPHVAGVIGPREAAAAGASTQARLPALQAGVPESATITEDGRAARYLVVFDVDPLNSKGVEALTGVAEKLPALLDQVGLQDATVSYAGDTALARETVDRTTGDLLRIAATVLAIDLLMLILFLRALVAPVYLLIASSLALTATLGLAAYFFQTLLGWDSLVYYVPFAAAVLLISIGSDYNVFLVGSIWEHAKIRPVRGAIATAVPRATRAISVAGIALAGSFALLALVPVAPFRELAFLLTVGVLLDSFFVRSLMVPALVSLFGRSSAWPGKLWRRRPRPAPPEL